MEPIASSGPNPLLRQGGSASAEVRVLLREGRVLGAEVLPMDGGGRLMLAIGRHKIPAESDLRLDPGTRFLAQVEAAAEGVVLQILSSGEDPESLLVRLLRGRIGAARPLGELLGELAAALRGPAAASPEVVALGLGLATLLGAPPAEGERLRSLLAFLGLDHESHLAHLGSATPLTRDMAALRSDLKALLLDALRALGLSGDSDELSGAVARTLSGLEAEQLLNLAREKTGEPLVLSFPFPDAVGWATARLAVPPRARPDGEATREDESVRVALGVTLSRLGPLRADLVLAPGHLSVRVLVTRAELVEPVSAALEAVRARFGDGRRGVELHVRLGSPSEAALGLSPDIRYLREHPLMNVAG